MAWPIKQIIKQCLFLRNKSIKFIDQNHPHLFTFLFSSLGIEMLDKHIRPVFLLEELIEEKGS